MPVTVTIAEHGAEAWTAQRASTDNDILPKRQRKKSKGVIQCSISPQDYLQKHITPSDNGLVWAAYHAYSDHHNLTLRPEDAWFAVISQLSFYINAHAEELRSMFVAHEGRKELIVHTRGSISTVDFGEIAECLSDMIQANVTRPDLQEWIVPSFSTTTKSDRAVAAILFMGVMQKYFAYASFLACGIPSVTLLGEKEDWENILKRLDVLPEFGSEPAQFADLLRPVLQGFIATYDSANMPATLDFWGRIADTVSSGSGKDYLSGWITAFCFWNVEGRRIGRVRQGVPMYRHVDFRDIPNGYATVPFTVNDNGKPYLTTMVAGSFGIEAFSQAEAISGEAVVDSIKPLTGWMMYHTNTFEDGHIRNL